MRRLAAIIACFGLLGALTSWYLSWHLAGGGPKPAPDSADSRVARNDEGRPEPPTAVEPPGPARPAPERPVLRATRDAIGDVPGMPGYDPAKLSLLGKAEASELFEREPRDETWAVPMEANIERRLAYDLGFMEPSAEVESIECRTNICLIELKAGEWSRAGFFATQVLGNADIHSMAGYEEREGTIHHSLFAVYGADHRELEDNQAWYAQHRAAVLEQLARKPMDLVAPPR